MAELLELQADRREPQAAVPAAGSTTALPGTPTREQQRAARAEIRRQIGKLERELAQLFGSTYPRGGIEWKVGAAGGPRLLSLVELERVRDGLVERLAEARAEIARRADHEEAQRELVERMIADPDDYHWVRVSNEDVGEPGCKHWHCRPRWGILGMFLGWWRVKLSSGCPLAGGRGPAPRPTPQRLPSNQRAAASGVEVVEAAQEAPPACPGAGRGR